MKNWFDVKLQPVLDLMFDRHSRSLCDDDCSFCADLRLSSNPAYLAEYRRIQNGKKRPTKKRKHKSKDKKRKRNEASGRTVKTGLSGVSSRQPRKSKYWLK